MRPPRHFPEYTFKLSFKFILVGMAMIGVLFPRQVVSQIPEGRCDTLILQNKRELSVYIDSVSGGDLYYRLCPDTVVRIRKIPLSYITSIRSVSDVADVELEGRSNLPSSIYTPSATWIFQKTGTGQIRKLKEGRRVKARVAKGGRQGALITGIFLGMTDSAMVIDQNRHGIVHVPKEKILRLTIPKLGGTAAGILGGALLGMALMLLFLMLVLLLVVALLTLMFTGSSDTSAARSDAKDMNRTALILLLLAIPMAFVAIPASIEKPFDPKEWTLSKAEQAPSPVEEPQIQRP